MGASTSAFLDHCRAIGVANATLVSPKLLLPHGMDDARGGLAAGGVRVSCVNHPFATFPNLELDTGEAARKLDEVIGMIAELGAPSIYLVTGGRGSLSWEEAAERFARLVAPCAETACSHGIALLVENASAFNVDIHMAHTLSDTIALAELAGIGVCIELHACWPEGGLSVSFRRAMPRCGLVQVSDYVLGDRTAPCRAVPGDGAIPLERLLGDLLEAGYQGLFDLELLGPRIEAEGPAAATRRAAERVSEILDRLGA